MQHRASLCDVSMIYFSPGGTTAAVLRKIAEGLGDDAPRRVNLTTPRHRTSFADFLRTGGAERGHCLVGAPVYAGRLPSLARDSISQLEGRGAPAVALVMYGNRDYGRALQELVTILRDRGFRVVGAAAFIGEHAFSSVFPIALDRPDRHDLAIARHFGLALRSKGADGVVISPQAVRGSVGTLVRLMPRRGPNPIIDATKCNGCAACSELCPVGAIDPQSHRYRDARAKSRCLGCMTCVKRCPRHARAFDFPLVIKPLLRRFFKEAIQQRREPMFVL